MKFNLFKNHKAFTLLELSIVIVTIGIIVSTSLPRFGRNELTLATNQIVNHIRYTQHLSMQDEKFNPNDTNWYKQRWQIVFGKSNYTDQLFAYTIFSDTARNNSGQADITEMAKNPQNPSKYLSGGYSGTLRSSDTRASYELYIGKKYNITLVAFSGGCSGGLRISFDNLGRPYTGNLAGGSIERPYQQRSGSSAGRITSTCIITLTHQSGDTQEIKIEPESGFVYL